VPDLSDAYRPEPQEVRLARIAAWQFGVVTLEQLRMVGLSDRAVSRRVASGRLHRLHRGVFAIGLPHIGFRGRAMAAQLALGPDAVVSHQSAGAILGIIGEHDGPIHVTLPRDRRDRPGIRVHESRSLRAQDTRIYHNVRVTWVQRTLVDLADVLTIDELERALSEAHRLGFVDRGARFPHHPGRKGLAAVLRRGVRMTRSQIERRLLAELRVTGDIALPLTNHRMHGYEADMYWPAHGLVVEIDDYTTHGDRLAFERDRRKQTAYALAGLTVIRITEETLPKRSRRCGR